MNLFKKEVKGKKSLIIYFTHTGENTSNEWCEKVTDEEYNKLPE